MKNYNAILLIFLLIVSLMNNAIAQNPVILDQFTADPSARVFNARCTYIHLMIFLLVRDVAGQAGSAWKTITYSHLQTLLTGPTME